VLDRETAEKGEEERSSDRKESSPSTKSKDSEREKKASSEHSLKKKAVFRGIDDLLRNEKKLRTMNPSPSFLKKNSSLAAREEIRVRLPKAARKIPLPVRKRELLSSR